ncbi:hypothetical protein CDO52_04815 [Nocardiopsis gilva YIM 90087]|uniref:Uncharacterized protein n=1 Tax=Nocardiopsis gilva YIM 90087 TaxID=1235441 RepID=A0A223S245_9ACTN|nr:hypothetical protein [Nocardiopsis gilva]ASU82196.1 hypothetical protein CDO52_04815 [Nocardiopsis gilva YIM 90087]
MTSTVKTWTVANRRELWDWARFHAAPVTITEETWDHITYQAEAICGARRYLCSYREQMPPCVALKRRANTFTVALFHEPAGAYCYHVREVIPETAGEGDDPAHLAALVAAANIQRERRAVCGATAENLVVLTTERTYPGDCAEQMEAR